MLFTVEVYRSIYTKHLRNLKKLEAKGVGGHSQSLSSGGSGAGAGKELTTGMLEKICLQISRDGR
jgi:hypothetical protein